MNIAVILAGGNGSRIGNAIPKQFLKIGSKTILEYSIEAFEFNSQIHQIIVVINSDYREFATSIIQKNKYKKIKEIISGGKERYESSISAIKICENDDDILLFHDCARPLVSQRIINECISSMDNYEAVTVAVNTSDTIYISNSKDKIESIPPRSSLKNAQTPQCFRLHTIRRAYQKGLEDSNFIPTDDCSVVFHYLPDVPIHIVNGENRNIKITYKEDLEIMSRLLEQGQ